MIVLFGLIVMSLLNHTVIPSMTRNIICYLCHSGPVPESRCATLHPESSSGHDSE